MKDDKKQTAAITAFDKKYGKLLIDPHAIAATYGYWSTGSPRIDALLGGGLRRGTLSEFYGPPGSGKSTLAMSTAREVIKRGGRVLYIDLERALDIRDEAAQGWLRVNGIDPFDTYNFQAIQDIESGEEMYQVIIDSLQGHVHQYIVVDSMAAVTTKAEMAGEIGESYFGAVGKLNSQALKVLFRKFGKNRETHITIINQARQLIGARVPMIKSTGGNALEHYVRTKIQFRKLGRKELPDGSDVLTEVRVLAEKALEMPRAVKIMISSKRGVDVLQEVLEFAEGAGYIHKSGAWQYLYEKPVTEEAFTSASKDARPQLPGFIATKQGEANMKEYLEAFGWYERLYNLAVNAVEVEDAEEDRDGND